MFLCCEAGLVLAEETFGGVVFEAHVLPPFCLKWRCECPWAETVWFVLPEQDVLAFWSACVLETWICRQLRDRLGALLPSCERPLLVCEAPLPSRRWLWWREEGSELVDESPPCGSP